MATSQDFVNWVCGPDLDASYLKYIFLSEQESLRRFSYGTTHRTIYFPEVKAFHVCVPSRYIQREVAQILGALDDKIEANRRLAQLVAELVAALLQQAAQGGERIRLGDVAEVRKGLSYTGAGLADAGMPMANLANAATFGGFKREGFKHYIGDYKPRHVARGGALLVANTDLTWKLEALGWPMLLPEDVPEALFSQDVSIVDFAPAWSHLRLPVWAHLFTGEARLRVEGMAYGTTVARFPPEALTGLQVPVINRSAAVLSQAGALLSRAWAAERETAALERLRGTLLPALMSGELRVREAEQLVD